MRRRGFYSFMSAGIVLISAVIAVLILTGRSPIPSPPKPVFPGLADRLGELAWAQISRSGTKVDFANVAGRWVVAEKDNYPADPAKLRRLLQGIAELTLIEPRPPDADRSVRIDPDGTAREAPALITLRGRTGDTVAEIIVAPAPNKAASGGAGAVSIRLPGAEITSPAHGTLELPDDVLGWLDRGIIDLPPTRIASLTLTGADGATLAIGRDAPDAAFAVADLPAGARLKTDAGLSDVIEALAGLAFDDVKPRALVELPQSGTARASFVTFDGLAIEMSLFAYQGADWVAIACFGTGAANAEGEALNERLTHWVFAIPAGRAKTLRTRLDDVTEPAKGL